MVDRLDATFLPDYCIDVYSRTIRIYFAYVEFAVREPIRGNLKIWYYLQDYSNDAVHRPICFLIPTT